MSSNGYNQAVISAQVDGAALNTSTTPTSILPPAAKWVMPANWMYIGKELRLKAMGRISNIVTTPGTLTLDVRFGSTVVFNGGAMQLNAVAKTNVSWWLEMMLTCRSIGNSTVATMFGMGQWTSESVVGSPLPSAGGAGCFNLPAATPAVGTGFDSTATQAIDLFATFSISNAGNSIQLHKYVLEDMN